MVSLAITENCPNDPPDTTADLLRDNALWFPDIPEPHLQLNEIHSAENRNLGSGFEPLCYAIFRDATNQRSLMKISVLWQLNYMAKIDFNCSTGDVLRIDRALEGGLENENEAMSFDIDDIGGEVIEEIKIGRLEAKDGLFGESGKVYSFEVGAHFLGIVDSVDLCSSHVYVLPKLSACRFLPIEEEGNYFKMNTQRKMACRKRW